ncbi:MAG TPA: DNA polymerase III subunit delta [Candidatus Ozemobacteraceae bacterium]|nr:DNA polymerase III subunit delta [Candidatus Ozemobacteraceae bacterium]
MDLPSLESAIAAQRLDKPVLLFAGREEFLKERAVVKLIEAYVAPEDRSDNVRRIDFGTATADTLLGDLGSFSFNLSHRVFVVTHPESLAASTRRGMLEKLAGGLPERTFLLVLSSEARIIGEYALALEDRAEKIDFWPPFENKLPEWLQKEARQLGAALAPDAADLLLQNIGGDLRLLSQELEKLCLAAGPGKSITAAQVAASVAYLRQDTIFDLLDAVGMRRLPEAMRLVDSLLLKGESPVPIWYLLSRMLRDFRLVHDIAADRPDLGRPLLEALRSIRQLSGKTDFRSNQERKSLTETIQREAASWPPVLTEALGIDQAMRVKTLAMAAGFTRDELTGLTPRLVEMDAALKNSPPNEALLLQRFIAEVVTGKRHQPPSQGEGGW